MGNFSDSAFSVVQQALLALLFLVTLGLALTGAAIAAPDSPETASIPQSPDSLSAVQTVRAAPAPAADAHLGSGEASYYGQELGGLPTASGEIFDPTELTAAHRTLPLGSLVRVTHARNGRSVVVRINDRGPSLLHRIIDLSEEAARRIGMLGAGTAIVNLELVR